MNDNDKKDKFNLLEDIIIDIMGVSSVYVFKYTSETYMLWEEINYYIMI